MGSILYFILLNVFLIHQCAFLTIIGRNRIKYVKYDHQSKHSSNFSKYIHYNWDDLTTISTTDSNSILDNCNISEAEDTEHADYKRSVEYWNTNTSETNETTTEEAFDSSRFSEKFLNCAHTTVEQECYQRHQNGTVFVPLYNMLFDNSNYIIDNNLLFVCPDFFDTFEEKFSSNIGIVSIVGICISTACIILHIIMFAVVKRLRNLPGYCLLSLCTSLLVAYVCTFVQYTLSENANCTVIGMIVFYSLLASFFWMNIFSFDVWKSIRMATIKLRLTSDRRILVRFAIYSSYAWGSPALIVIATLITNHLSTDETYKLIFKVDTCWFQYKTALLIYFATPLFILLSVNILFFISSFYMVAQSAMTSREIGTQVGSNLRSRLFLSLKLVSTMGLMWIFGVIATVTQRQWLYYLYSICNAFQGVFIFFSFTVNDRTMRACKTVINKKISIFSTQHQQETTI